MTRNSELNCEDLFGCDHRAETPISEGGQIVGWLCRCGRQVNAPRQPTEPIHFTCPNCGNSHDRGHVNGLDVFRCLSCGYQGKDNMNYRQRVLSTIRKMSSEDTPYGRIGLVFVRELVEQLRNGTLTAQVPDLLKTELLALTRDGLIELRSWSGIASEVTDIINFCPVAPDGSALAIIRVIASTQVWR